MLKVMIIILIIILSSNVQAKVGGFKQELTGNSLSKAQTIYNPPEFPPDDEIKKIKNRIDDITFPRLVFNLGISLRQIDNTELNKTFRAIESIYGFDSHKTFDNPPSALNAGVRLLLNKKISIWLESVFTNSLDDEDNGERGVRIAYMSISFLYTITSSKNMGPSLSLGIGLGSQRLRAVQSYSVLLDDWGTLNEIKINTNQKNAIPLTALIELPGASKSRYSFYIAGKYIISPDINQRSTTYYQGDQYLTLKASLKGFQLNAGISVGF